MCRTDFEQLGINRACASRELHDLQEFAECRVDRLPPRIELDRFLEVFDSFVAVLGYGSEAACEDGTVQSVFRRRFDGFAPPDNRADEVLRAQAFVGALQPGLDRLFGLCLFAVQAKTADGRQGLIVAGSLVLVSDGSVSFGNDDHQVSEWPSQFATAYITVRVGLAYERVIVFLDLSARRFSCNSQ